ncbi:MAG TPA: hypothetical protein GX396_00170 [Tissierellia bacterium]|jgi:uncharacterized membrane protein YgaE (UPF0421/DUF939 family)|nr:hypothetical protein [Tissierellia bacterium]
MKIGMRNIKTTISVFICLLVFELINRENAIFACIAAVICLQNTILDSLEKGIARIIGTIIGGAVGIIVLFVVNNFSAYNILIFIIPIGIMVLIHICVMINMKQSVVICCVVYLSIMISKSHEGGYLLYTVNRVLDTSFGILVALMVNKYLTIPESIRHRIKHDDTEETEEEK